MKTIISSLFFIFSASFCYTQEILQYSEVITVDSITKQELHNRAKNWFISAYKSSKDVIQNDDKESGQIIGKAVMKYTPSIFMGSEKIKGYISYTVKIFLKDGRYKYEFSNFVHEPLGNMYGSKFSVGLVTTANECPSPSPLEKNWSNNVWDDIKAQINIDISRLIVSLNLAMMKQSEAQNDEW